MGLLQNITIWAQYPGHRRGGSTATGTDGNGTRSILGIKGSTQLTPFASGAAWVNTSSFPVGWVHGNGWFPPMKPDAGWPANLGTQTLAGSGAATGTNLRMGLNAVAPLSGSGTISYANGALGQALQAAFGGTGDLTPLMTTLASISATLSASGTVSSAVGQLALLAAAALAGTGDITGTAKSTLAATASLSGSGDLSAQIAGALNAVASILASGDLTNVVSGAGNLTAAFGGTSTTSAAIRALAHLAITLAGTSTTTGSMPSKAWMSASISVTGELLNTSNVAAAVWNALSATFNTAGTMGSKLNSASAAGDPWTAELPGSYTAGQAGNIVGNNLDASSADIAALVAIAVKLLRNKTVTDPTTGVMTVYDDDGSVLYTAQMYEGTDTGQTYRGEGAERRERLV